MELFNNALVLVICLPPEMTVEMDEHLVGFIAISLALKKESILARMRDRFTLSSSRTIMFSENPMAEHL